MRKNAHSVNASSAIILSLVYVLYAHIACASNMQIRKFFIQRIDVGPDIPTLPSQLRIRAHEELPLDILEQIGLIYEDPSAYLDVKDWNPLDKFSARKEENILRRFHEMQMKAMMTLALSYVPQDKSQRRLILTAKWIDLDRMNCILSKATGIGNVDNLSMPIIRDTRPCRGDKNVFQSVITASVELEDFGAFRKGLRQVFAKIFHIPEIHIIKSADHTYAPGSHIILKFEINANEAEDDVQENIILDRYDKYRADIRMYSLPGSKSDEICSTPEEFGKRIHCRKDGLACYTDFILLEPVKFKEKNAVVVPHIVSPQSVATAEYKTPSFEGDFLVVGRVVEPKHQFKSDPSYSCIRVRMPRFSLGIGPRFSPNFPEGDGQLLYIPGQQMGLDLYFARNFTIQRSYFLPSFRTLGILGITHVSGARIFRCPSDDGEQCLIMADESLMSYRLSDSTSIELRSQGQLELFRIYQVSLAFLVDLGIGIEYVSSTPIHERDGWHISHIWGLGGGMHIMPTPSSRLGIQVLYQQRTRFDHAAMLPASQLERPLIPEADWDMWFQLIGEWSLPK